MALDFTGARAKVNHALEHLNLFDAQLKGDFASKRYAVGGHYKPEASEIDLYALGGKFPVEDVRPLGRGEPPRKR